MAVVLGGLTASTASPAAPPGLEELKSGDEVMCNWPVDNTPHRSQIIQVRSGRAGAGDRDGDAVCEYFVHFLGLDRRWDSWVTADRISSGALEPRADAAAKIAARGSADEYTRRTRFMKRKSDEIHCTSHSEGLDPVLEKEHEEHTKVKNIRRVVMGPFDMDTWYYSPYPEEFAKRTCIFVCEFTLKYMKRRKTYARHMQTNTVRTPPGQEIYRQPAPPSSALEGLPPPSHLTIFEVDGSEHKVYCQCLCLLAKLFIDHKTLFLSVEPFMFYVLCEKDDTSHRIVGYFSKEKLSVENNVLACILVLPPHQRKGYGKMLISLAYELSAREGKVGSPEKPLSDLGQVTFRSYWTQMVLDVLARHHGNLSIKQIATLTAIKQDDVVSTLQSLNLIRFWKGQHVVNVNPRIVEEHVKANQRRCLVIDSQHLHWTPQPLFQEPVASGAGANTSSGG